MPKISIVSRDVNGIAIAQRRTDGFINGTAMCVAHSRDISDWLKTEDTWELVVALADDLGIEPKDHKSGNSVYTRVSGSYPSLVVVKRGSPAVGGGTWIHPDLATQLAQWCNKLFAIQVSRWVQEWIITSRNPLQSDVDRMVYRDALKDEARVRMSDQVKEYLQAIQRYDDNEYRGRYFSRLHDRMNIILTSETAKQMRTRLSALLGREVRDYELIRDYFPALTLQRYISLCEVTANLINDGINPLEALEKAKTLALPRSYEPQRIEFAESIKFVRERVLTGQAPLQLTSA